MKILVALKKGLQSCLSKLPKIVFTKVYLILSQQKHWVFFSRVWIYGNFPINCSVREPLERLSRRINSTNQAIQVKKNFLNHKRILFSAPKLFAVQKQNMLSKLSGWKFSRKYNAKRPLVKKKAPTWFDPTYQTTHFQNIPENFNSPSY
jgi:hypothetical protein